MYFNQIEFGKRIKSLRTDRNITQDRLAEELNISCRHLRNIENGAKAPSYDILLTISELFSVSTDCLLKGNEHTYSDLKRRLESVMRDLEEIHDGIPV